MSDNQNSTPRRWQPENLGPRQAKAFNDAWSDLSWEAKTEDYISDYGSGTRTTIGGSTMRPIATTRDLIYDKYNGIVSAKNVRAIIADIQAATAKMKETRPVIDERRSVEVSK